MPTRRLPDALLNENANRRQGCMSLLHDPPRLCVPGVYQHTCPKCGDVTHFRVLPRSSSTAAYELEPFAPAAPITDSVVGAFDIDGEDGVDEDEDNDEYEDDEDDEEDEDDDDE